MCLNCYACILCEPCYSKRQAYNSATKSELGFTYYGTNHNVKPHGEDGPMTINGAEATKFTEWLKDLKENKWKVAWQSCCVAEY